MIEAIEFTNFKALRKTHVPLAPFTLLLGPNGSGKTTVLQALQLIAAAAQKGNLPDRLSLLSITADSKDAAVELHFHVRNLGRQYRLALSWTKNAQPALEYRDGDAKQPAANDKTALIQWARNIQIFSLNPAAIAKPVPVNARPLQSDGTGLAAVLDDLKDNYPERWEAVLAELQRWLPEYDYIMFDKPKQGEKALVLRTKRGAHRIPANELSQGTLIALALLTLAYVPNPPSVIGLEEIDRGLHPRLLRDLQDALYRLSYPKSCGETRSPIQVIATTHSPYLLDLYRDRPEEVVLAEKEGLEVTMRRLADIPNYSDILGDSPLSEVWYSGVLSGVSVKP